MDNIKKIKEERAALVEKNKALRAKADGENRSLTDDEMAEFRKNVALDTALADQLKYFVSAEELDKRNAERGLDDNMAAAHRAELREYIGKLQESRTALDGTTGVPMPKFVYDGVITALRTKSQLVDAVDTIHTETGADLIFPTFDPNTLTFTPADDYVATNPQAAAFGSSTLKAYNYRGLILIANTLINDAGFDLEGYMVDQMTKALARTINSEATSCTTTGHIRGFMADATEGVVVASATAITYDDLVDLTGSVESPYSDEGVGKFIMKRSTRTMLQKIKDSDGRPIFNPSPEKGVPPTILGYEVVIDESMPAPTAGNKPIAFGDPKAYKLRMVNSVNTTVLRELYATYDAIGILVKVRMDGKLIDAGSHPIKYLQMAAQ